MEPDRGTVEHATKTLSVGSHRDGDVLVTDAELEICSPLDAWLPVLYNSMARLILPLLQGVEQRARCSRMGPGDRVGWYC